MIYYGVGQQHQRIEPHPGNEIRLYKTTWENTFPAVAVTSIDFVSTEEVVTPFLVAITAEP